MPGLPASPRAVTCLNKADANAVSSHRVILVLRMVELAIDCQSHECPEFVLLQLS